MDLEPLARLVPLGGVTLLLIYLLGLLMTERISWVRERAELQAAWALERSTLREQHRVDMANATSDLKEQIDFLRQRVTELEKENAEIRKLIRGA